MILSSLWPQGYVGDARPVGVSDCMAAAGGSFRALFSDRAPEPRPAPETRAEEPVASVDPIDQAHADGFAMGFEEGHRIATEAAADDQAARERLIDALERFSPVSSGMLAAMLSTAVLRLVGEIAGKVEIDEDLLRRRCEVVAAFIDESEGKGALHLNPADMPLIESLGIAVPIVGDPAMRRGCIRLDTVDGWIEDGPDVRLSRLQALLDDMEGRL